jgi:general stress protein 26
MPNPVTETEVKDILESKLNMQIATTDEEGYPLIQPIWFLYDDKEYDKIYTATQKMTKKVQNIRRNPDKIYFSIDDANYPYKGGREEQQQKYLKI